MDGLSIIECITLLVSLVGACAWIPIVYEKVRRPKLVAKLQTLDWVKNGNYYTVVRFEGGLKKEYYGNIYFLGLHVVCRHNDISVQNFSVKVKYNSVSKELDAIVHYVPTVTVTNNGKEKVYMNDKHKNILFCPVLKKDECHNLETIFLVETQKIDVEYFKLIVKDTKNKEYIIKFGKEDFMNAAEIFN